MRRMVCYPNAESASQLRCTDCEWTFHVQKPLTSEAPLELQKTYAERWYTAHRCSRLPAPMAPGFVARQELQPQTIFRPLVAEG